MNTLYYGDNLNILREYIKDESVDLIYLDPPFNSNRNYNVLFKDESGAEAPSQIQAFEDTWHWHTGGTAETYHELLLAGDEVSQMIEAFHSFIGNNQMMAYLVMMAIRLKELHRVLKPTGSLYLHCDPTASHYLKILLDTIFSPKHFGNELVWQRTNSKGLAFTRFANNHDIIFRYAKSENHTWNAQYTPHNEEYLRKFYRYTEEGTGRRYRLADLTNPNKNRPNLTYEFLGVTRVWRWTRERMQKAYEDGIVLQNKEGGVPVLKRYLDEQEGNPVGDVWTDLLPVQSQSAEILGYPTQKPVALLERIISASSNEGDVVLDPFCGCGTTIAAAQKLNRQWIGMDITHLSIALQKYRLKDSFNLEEKKDYKVVGEPEDLEGAKQLASEDRYQFQWWALSLIKARPLGGNSSDKTGKKGADKGIDGTITFIDDTTSKAKRVIVSVKSGHPNVSHIRDLGHVIDRENAAIGVYLTLEPPTKPMLTEAAGKGFYHSPGWNKDYPRLQIVTVEDLLSGKQIEMPPSQMTFRQAERVKEDTTNQSFLGFE